MTFNIKRGDTSPSMLATLQDANGSAVDITGATVRFHMRKTGSSATVVDEAATVVTADAGLVRYDWQTSDTDTVGSYQAEFEVTYSDGTIETFPNNSYIPVNIVSDIA